MMRRYLPILVILVMALVTPVLATDGQTTAPDESISYLFKQAANFTPATTVVIAVADSNDYNIIALADVIAEKEGAPLFITSKDKLDPQLIEIIQQLMTYADVTNAIVVGVGSNASSIADLIAKISTPEANLTVTRIIGDNVYTLSLKITVYAFSSSTYAVVSDGNVPEDIAKGLMITLNDGIPLIYEQADFNDINATLKLLGVTTVYTTPAVEATTETKLSDAGYTVNSSWRGLDLSENLDVLLATVEPAKNATVVVPSNGDFIRLASVMGVNASIIATNTSTKLGDYATDYLSTNKPQVVLVFGNNSRIADSVLLDIASASGGKVERVFFTTEYMMIDRLGLIEAGYIYPIVVVDDINVTDNHYKYTFRNIGFSDAVRYGDYAIRVEFTKKSGSFENAKPEPIYQNDTVVVFYHTNTVYPYDTFNIEFDTTVGTSFETYPKITYNAMTLAGAIITIQSYLDWFIEKVQSFKEWFIDMFKKFFGTIVSHIPLPGPAATAVAAIIVFLIFWTIIGTVAYVVKAYVLKKRIESPVFYGPIGWVLGRRG